MPEGQATSEREPDCCANCRWGVRQPAWCIIIECHLRGWKNSPLKGLADLCMRHERADWQFIGGLGYSEQMRATARQYCCADDCKTCGPEVEHHVRATPAEASVA